MVEKRLAREVGARSARVGLSLTDIHNLEMTFTNSEKVQIKIKGEFEEHHLQHVLMVSGLRLPTQSLSHELTRHIEDIEGIRVKAYENAQPRILIGQDDWRIICTRDLREVKHKKLAIYRSLLGWSVHGLDISSESGRTTQRTCAKFQESNLDEFHLNERLDDIFRQYFLIDNLAVTNSEDIRVKHSRADTILRETTRRMGNLWEIGLLWKEDTGPQIDGKPTAEKRLLFLERKLDRDSRYAELYYNEMKRFLKAGYAEKVKWDDTPERIWYLPHFGVTNAEQAK